MRLNSGTDNVLLGEAYKLTQSENHPWLQGIHYLLNVQGFGDVWNNPSAANATFHKAFKLRLDDQFKQARRSKLHSSSRFTTMSDLIDDRVHNSYIYKIRSPEIRTIFLRLRIDMNHLSTSRSNKNMLAICPLCSREPESVNHFILRCSKFTNERDTFITSILPYTPTFISMDDINRLRYILGLHCPPEVISHCCKYVSGIYSLREKEQSNIVGNV